MGTAEQCAPHHRAQIMGILNAVAQHQERGLALGLCSLQQVFHRHILDLPGKRRHALVAVRTGHQPELVGVHPLDGSAHFLGHGGVVGRHSWGHALGQQHGIHAGTALEQFGHGVFAVDQALVLGCFGLLVRITAGTARGIFFFHGSFSSQFLWKDASCI